MPEYTSEMTPEFRERLLELNDPAVISQRPVTGVTITAGELIARLQHLERDTPVIAYSDQTDYVNVTDLHYDPEQGPAAVLELTHDFDTRQW